MQLWRQVYLLTILSLILAVFCAQVHPNYLNNDWRRIRVTIFCCVAGISVVPACHWVWLNDGFASDVVQVMIETPNTPTYASSGVIQDPLVLKVQCVTFEDFKEETGTPSGDILELQHSFAHPNQMFFLILQLFLPRVIIMYLIAGSAFLFYVTKIPERYFPGESSTSAGCGPAQIS